VRQGLEGDLPDGRVSRRDFEDIKKCHEAGERSMVQGKSTLRLDVFVAPTRPINPAFLPRGDGLKHEASWPRIMEGRDQ
jgi:hypothetical protein